MKTLHDLHPHLVDFWDSDGRVSGIGEQALQVNCDELRRLVELPQDVMLLCILPDLPPRLAGYDSLPREWIPYPRPGISKQRTCYVHISHRFCFRDAQNGIPLTIEALDPFLARYRDLLQMELAHALEIQEANRA